MVNPDYLSKMRELLQEAGEFTDEEIRDIVKVARGYAGGMASGRARRGEGQEGDTDVKGMMGKMMDMLKGMMGKMKGQESMMPMAPLMKLPKDHPSVQYADEAMGEMDCQHCRFFCAGFSCNLVEGTVEAGGGCKLGEEQPQYLAVAPDGKRFSEFPFDFMAPPASIQVLPKPGTYAHPTYGEIRLTVDDLKEFVSNFKEGVYGQQSPIELDFEHSEGDLSKRGAVGYIKSLNAINGYRGGVAAEIEWTDRGKEALKADAYQYFSPEWYDEWKQPKTGETHHNVLVGGALTTRPFFKSDVLKPLAASEDGVKVYRRLAFATKTEDGESYPSSAYLVVPDPDSPSTWKLRIWESPTLKVTRAQLGRAAAALGPGGFRGQRVQLSPEDKTSAIAKLRALYKAEGVPDDEMPSQLQASQPDVGDVHVPGFAKIKKGGKEMEIQLTEEQRAALAEGKPLELTEDQLKALEPKEASERLAAENRKLSERLEAVERERAAERQESRRRRFTEIVQGRAQGTPHDGPAFVGDVAKHVSVMETLADAKGEDGDVFKDYVQTQQAHADQIRASALFAELGHGGNGSDGSAEAEVTRKAQAKGGDFAAAVQSVLKEDPVLARRYTEERNQRARIK